MGAVFSGSAKLCAVMFFFKLVFLLPSSLQVFFEPVSQLTEEEDVMPGDGKKGKGIGLDWVERAVHTHTQKMEEVEMHRQHLHVE